MSQISQAVLGLESGLELMDKLKTVACSSRKGFFSLGFLIQKRLSEEPLHQDLATDKSHGHFVHWYLRSMLYEL